MLRVIKDLFCFNVRVLLSIIFFFIYHNGSRSLEESVDLLNLPNVKRLRPNIHISKGIVFLLQMRSYWKGTVSICLTDRK